MMEIITALQQGVLVPWQKTHGEEVKTAYQLLRNDLGGLVYQPVPGIHEDVGMIDFISLYPSIMTYCNISPELPVPKDLGVSPFPPGLIPRTLGAAAGKKGEHETAPAGPAARRPAKSPTTRRAPRP